MEQNLHVTVRSYAENLDDFGLVESTESDTVTVPATISKGGSEITLTYEQKNDNGECKTTLVLSNSKITLTRSGAIESVMEFIEGKTTKTLYTVPPFSFDAEIETKRIRGSLDEGGGTLELRYLLTIGGAKKNMRLSLTVY